MHKLIITFVLGNQYVMTYSSNSNNVTLADYISMNHDNIPLGHFLKFSPDNTKRELESSGANEDGCSELAVFDDTNNQVINLILLLIIFLAISLNVDPGFSTT